MPVAYAKQESYSGLGGLCLMFGEGHPDRKDYCPACTLYIRARDLRDIRKDWDKREYDES